MIPESHEKGYGKIATWWLIIGFVTQKFQLENF